MMLCYVREHISCRNFGTTPKGFGCSHATEAEICLASAIRGRFCVYYIQPYQDQNQRERIHWKKIRRYLTLA